MEIPKGFRTYLFDQSALKRTIETRLIDLFLRWGFREVIPPTVEYYDTAATGASGFNPDKTFKLSEPGSGKIISLRPDITPQIVHTAAVHLRQVPRPLRFCYCGNVFRHAEPGSGERREIFQGGVELIGLDSPEADAEMIAIAVEALEVIGLNDFKITVGQVDYFRGIISGKGLSEQEKREISRKIRKKDLSGLEEYLNLKGINGDLRETLLTLPSLLGGREVIQKARVASNNKITVAALDNIEKVVNIVSSYGLEGSLLIDLGEIRGFGYYTGINFDGFVKGVGREVCGGGRYDNLHGSFGDPCPATGFAVDIGAVLDIMEKQGRLSGNNRIDYLIMDFSPDKGKGIELARRVRKTGRRAARDIVKRDKESSLAYARSMKIKKGLLLGVEEIKENELMEIDMESGEEKRMDTEEFLCRLQ